MRLEQGENPVAEICMLKNQATTTLAFCASEGVQIFGGAGFMRGVKVERIYREVKVNAIGGGTEEIMKDLAGRQMGLWMIGLWHCVDARSFRPLWALEEIGVPYRLEILPFPLRRDDDPKIQEAHRDPPPRRRGPGLTCYTGRGWFRGLAGQRRARSVSRESRGRSGSGFARALPKGCHILPERLIGALPGAATRARWP